MVYDQKDTESVLEVNFEGHVQCQEPEVVGRTFQQRQHYEQRQSCNMIDSLHISEYLGLAKW